MSDRQTDTSHPSSTSYASSIVALVLGRQIWPRLLIASIFGFAVCCRQRIAMRLWRCSTKPPRPGALKACRRLRPALFEAVC